MSDDWDTVTKIGSKVRGPGAAQRETVIRGEAALNAARRQGAVIATEKKYGGANTRANPEGQRDTMLDRANDVVKPRKVGKEVGEAIRNRRSQLKNDKGATMTQADLAAKISKPTGSIVDFERGEAAPDQQVLGKLENILKIHLRGDKVGQELVRGKKK